MIKKASGEMEPFSEDKLRESLKKAQALPEIINEIVEQIVSGLKDGASTSDIYHRAFSLLRKKHRFAAGRYRLKNAIMELGPTGYPFERFVAEILKSQGFSVEVGKIVQGACVTHELDIIAMKNNRHIMVECKFHNQAGIKSDVKTALYVQARFEDLKKRWQVQPGHGEKLHQAWLVTNTKLTSDAIKYANCVGINVIGWSHPPGESLQDLIEESGLHPLTSLTALSLSQKRQLLERGLILCKDILDNKNLLPAVGVNEAKISFVLKEIEELCKLQ
ncbi:MAG: restriction endonuclease [Candidatus Nealsonbacteria bacterium]|nr:restriction endonuclease [Candidatus Nealsonbacteria bacterium]